MYSIAYKFASSELEPKVGKLPNVYVTASTRYGEARVRITKQQWDVAISGNKGSTNARAYIAIKVKSRLNEAGAILIWLSWDEITFGPISSQKEPENPPQPHPSALALHNARVSEMAKQAEAMAAEEDFEDATRLFPGFFGSTPPPSDFDACGCVPHPITAM